MRMHDVSTRAKALPSQACCNTTCVYTDFFERSSQELDGLLSSQSRHHLEHAIVETARVFDEESVHMLQGMGLIVRLYVLYGHILLDGLGISYLISFI